MKVVYEKTMQEKLHDAIRAAAYDDRPIAHIELTWAEMIRLSSELKHLPTFVRSAQAYIPFIVEKFEGIPLKVV